MRTEFERVSPEAVGIRSTVIVRFLDKLESGFTEMHGLMIMRHGKVCAEGWWSPYAPGLRHGLQSLSKTYAATAVGIAVTEGIVQLDERIIDIFPDEAPAEPSENLQKLTVRDVLCMGCGMDTMPAPTKDWIRDFLATPVNHVPGTTYMYNSVGSTLLCAIVRRRSGESVHAYLTSRLFEKIGIDPSSMSWMLMPDGTEMGGGGLFSTTENNLRLMKLYADGGVWEGERILSAEYVQKAISLQNQSASETKCNPEARDNFVGYGFQIWLCRPRGVYRADGAMGQFVIVAPGKDMLISINETANGAHWAQKTLDTVWEFLKEVEDGVLPEDDMASQALSRRLRTLSLAAPSFAPFSKTAAAVSGVWYAVCGGEVHFENSMIKMMSGAPEPGGITRFCFTFGQDMCEMCYEQNGIMRCVYIAMDGTRRLNEIHDGPVTKLLLHGWWSAPKVFSVAARWIETCFEKRLDFHFNDKNAAIKQQTIVGGLEPMNTKFQTAIIARPDSPQQF